jgi:hypothetical protein
MTQLGKGRAAAITPAEMAALADDLGCHPADLEAIAQVESSGFGWFKDGRIKILFEKHWFYKLISGPARTEAVNQGLARKSWVSPSKGGYRDQKSADDRYRLLEAAVRINREGALKSVSVGRFQIMGFNHKICGFASAEEMWAAFLDSEANQLRAFGNFLKSKGLDKVLRRRDFVAVEKGYNGGGLGGAYARRMKAASDKLRAGKWKNYAPGTWPPPAIEAPAVAPPLPEPQTAPDPSLNAGDGRPNWTPDEDSCLDEARNAPAASGIENASGGAAGGLVLVGGALLANGQYKAALIFFGIAAAAVAAFFLIRQFRK